MKRRVLHVAGCIAAALLAASAAAADGLDTARIEALTGLKGVFSQAEGVFKVTLPRSDIKPDVAGVKLVPAQGLGAWAAFQRTGEHVMVMGDIVMRESEVNPVMSTTGAWVQCRTWPKG